MLKFIKKIFSGSGLQGPGASRSKAVKKYGDEIVSRFEQELRNSLIGRERRATLLQPRRSSEPLPFAVSKMGGIPNLKGFAEWPRCDGCGLPLNFVLQLYRADFPQLYFPQRANLFQLFRCPNRDCPGLENNAEFYDLKMFHYYHDVPSDANKDLTLPETDKQLCPRQEERPHECSLQPTTIEEYPCAEELGIWNLYHPLADDDKAPRGEYERSLRALVEDFGRRHQCDAFELFKDYALDVLEPFFAQCVTKCGGYPSWIQCPQELMCKCGKKKEFFFQLSSDRKSHGLMICDLGNIYYSVCRECGEKSVESRWDCG